jgi:hypothetical protein
MFDPRSRFCHKAYGQVLEREPNLFEAIHSLAKSIPGGIEAITVERQRACALRRWRAVVEERPGFRFLVALGGQLRARRGL